MHNFKIFISPFTNPFINLSLENHFTKLPGYCLFLYRNDPSIILGRNQNPWKEVVLSQLNSNNVELVRRFSGGGTVYHDLGNTNYTFYMPKSEFHRSIAVSRICLALRSLDIPAEVNERYDITLDDCKISGSAYKLTKDRAYHHGTMLIDTQLNNIKQYLTLKPPDFIHGFGTDSVRSKVTRLREWSDTIDHVTFCDAVIDTFKHTYGNVEPVWVTSEVVEQVRDTIEQVKSKEWVFGQTPKFQINMFKKFEFGLVGVVLTIDKGEIVRAQIQSSSPAFSKRVEKVLVGQKLYELTLDPSDKDLQFLIDWILSGQ